MIDKVAQIRLLCHFYMLGLWVDNERILGISAKVAREGQTYLCQNVKEGGMANSNNRSKETDTVHHLVSRIAHRVYFFEG